MIITSSGEFYENDLDHELNRPIQNDVTQTAMNDNGPPVKMEIPQIAGGLSKPPKPANDNGNRFKAAGSEDDSPPFDPVQNLIRTQEAYDFWTGPDKEKTPVWDWGVKGVLPKVSDLLNVEPSREIINRTGEYTPQQKFRDELHEVASGFNLKNDVKDNESLGKTLGLDDVQKRIDNAINISEQRMNEKLEHFNQAWKQIKPPDLSIPTGKKKTK